MEFENEIDEYDDNLYNENYDVDEENEDDLAEKLARTAVSQNKKQHLKVRQQPYKKSKPQKKQDDKDFFFKLVDMFEEEKKIKDAAEKVKMLKQYYHSITQPNNNDIVPKKTKENYTKADEKITKETKKEHNEFLAQLAELSNEVFTKGNSQRIEELDKKLKLTTLPRWDRRKYRKYQKNSSIDNDKNKKESESESEDSEDDDTDEEDKIESNEGKQQQTPQMIRINSNYLKKLEDTYKYFHCLQPFIAQIYQ